MLPAVAATAAVGLALWGQVQHTPLEASSHREAPLIADDPVADNTDLYAFRDPKDASRVVIIANYIPFELPHGGPNYSTFGENVRYEVHVKNDGSTNVDDITYRFTFTRTNEDPSTFFNIRLGKQNLKTTYVCEKLVDGVSVGNIVASGVVPPNNIGPRSINGGAGLGLTEPYETLRTNAITMATGGGGEKILCAPSDDPFFADLGAIFDLAGLRPGSATDGLSRKNTHSIVLSIPIQTLQKTNQPVTAAANILDPNYVIGVWASASRPAMQTFSAASGNGASGAWVQVSRLGMPLTNEVINPIGSKDAWNAVTPYNEAAITDDYLSNPELGLYTADNAPVAPAAPKTAGQTFFGEAVPALNALRMQTKSLAGQPVIGPDGFDFRNQANGLSGLAGSSLVTGTAFDPTLFGPYLLVPGKPRSADIKPIFHTGVPNLPPYQLATGKTPLSTGNAAVNPLSAGKPFINNFLPLTASGRSNPGGDMLRLNMAVPTTPRDSKDFSNQGLLQAAVLGLTDPRFNGDASLQNIPNMDGFPNGRRLEDAVDQIELKAVGGLVLAAVGLYFDDFMPGSTSGVTPKLVAELQFTSGVEVNDTTFRAEFPYVQTPWSGTGSASGPTNVVVIPDLIVSTAMPVEAGTYNNVTITRTGNASFNGPIVVNGILTVQTGGTLSTRGVLATNCLPITGPGSFVLQAGATLSICNSDGISASGATGAIQLAGSRSFAADANYEYNGLDAQTSGAGLPAQVRSLTVNNAAGLTLNNGGVRIVQTLALTNGNLTTSSAQLLTLLSTPTAGTALVVNTNGAVTGPAVMQRAIDPAFNAGLGYRHYSSPVSNTTLADLATPGFTPVFNQAYNTAAEPNNVTPFPTVFGYNQNRVVSAANSVAAFDQGFVVPLASDPMGLLTGYTVNIGANQVVDLNGTLNNGPISRSNLTRGSQPQSGWQFLGNPYPSPLDFSQTAGVTRTNVDDAVYVYQSTGQYVGQYRSYVNGVGNPLVSSMQGFFARVSAGQTTGSFALNNAARVTTFAAAPSFNRGTSETRPLVKLRLQNSSPLIDEAYVYFEQGATPTFDARFDAYKLTNSSGLNLSSIIASDELSVNGLPMLVGTVTVPLNLTVPATGSYTLNAVDLLNFGAGTLVYLLDTETGARINLAEQPTYTFKAQALTMPGRFSLRFGPSAAPLANTAAALANQVQLFPNPAHSSFTLLLPAELGRVPVTARLYNQIGQLVTQRTLSVTAAGASAQFDVSGLAPGVYSLRLIGGPAPVVKRVVIE
ncbi:DUF4331 family protein [Hymenobacter glacialis]|uniref:Secretion system C-terminal sorting domain-containing protein n=1 Tax=Hymenobacter glacialis TaxID=1908236 RepID=A0A1G1T6C5_9BACT|nr:DUF4331 family protein [Hymenobacter glacialis]OGX86409.1 hypothetical protein BEN48_13080 [Hymenobacter glacialis]